MGNDQEFRPRFYIPEKNQIYLPFKGIQHQNGEQKRLGTTGKSSHPEAKPYRQGVFSILVGSRG